jgi:hypothetical protein
MFPLLGSIVYFVARRSWSRHVSPVAERRNLARRRLREINVQLAHWRGPALLAEAGEELLALGKYEEAERLLREARESGAGIEEVNFALAQALEMKGRFAEAEPLLAELCQVSPDFRRGEARVHLARCLDESGRLEEAEVVLRQLLEERRPVEAQVRLARILMAKGQREEAVRLLEELLSETRGLPRYLQRMHGAWLRAARRLRRGKMRLPRPAVEGAIAPRPVWELALLGAGVAVVLIGVGAFLIAAARLYWSAAAGLETIEERGALRSEFRSLDQTFPWRHPDDLQAVVLAERDLERYLALRRRLAPALGELLRARAALREHDESETAGLLVGAASQWPKRQLAFEKSVLSALRETEMGPRELEKLTTLIEWRFLRRPEALLFGLPDHYRADWLEGQAYRRAGAPVESSGDSLPLIEERWREDYRKELARREAKLADLEAQAGREVGLAPATEALLKSHRRELEALGPEGLELILLALDGSLPWLAY